MTRGINQQEKAELLGFSLKTDISGAPSGLTRKVSFLEYTGPCIVVKENGKRCKGHIVKGKEKCQGHLNSEQSRSKKSE